MTAEKFDISLHIIQLLTAATVTKRLRWTLMDYMFYNGRNKALVTYAKMLSESDVPVMLDDPSKANLLKSYYCEFEGSGFCLMNCQQVLEGEQPPKEIYELLVQSTQFDTLGHYAISTGKYQTPIMELIKWVEMQAHQAVFDLSPLYRSLSKMEEAIASFDPTKESLLAPFPPSPPYKHCCVIDRNGYYVTFVSILLENANGEKREFIQGYTLKDGEKLLDVNPPSKMVRAHWNGSAWEEGATPEEIEKYYKSHRL